MSADLLKSIEETIKTPSKQSSNFISAPTGCRLMDLGVGGGVGYGYPFGKIINLVGDKSSGKN